MLILFQGFKEKPLNYINADYFNNKSVHQLIQNSWISKFFLPCSPERNSVRLSEFVCKKSFNAKHLTVSHRQIRMMLTEFLSGKHGSFHLRTFFD
jgi:hypothetical protein